jgi:hypothetical protein
MVNVDDIMSYECGQLSDHGMVYLFADLIESGDAWTLQGSYGRTAMSLINAGIITMDGVVDEVALEDALS